MPLDEDFSRPAIIEIDSVLERVGTGPVDTSIGNLAENEALLRHTIRRLGPAGFGDDVVQRIPQESGFAVQRQRALVGVLKALRGQYANGRTEMAPPSNVPGFLQLEKLLTRFHQVALQLMRRHGHRDSLRIMDEYDVQDLLYALLRIHFDDIREEEWTPSYAGQSARMDFLLKKQRMVVEVKKTRDNLTDKEVGNELLVDIARYKGHADCSTLVCFVYDPDQRIHNPNGLKNDLEAASTDKLAVVVHICQH